MKKKRILSGVLAAVLALCLVLPAAPQAQAASLPTFPTAPWRTMPKCCVCWVYWMALAAAPFSLMAL